MKKLLHIIATPREEESRTLQVTEAFLSALKKKHPEVQVDELNVTSENFPKITARTIDGKMSLFEEGELSAEHKGALEEVMAYIERFLSADAYLISTPMWNFSIPYPLKHYIDIIVQPRYLFRYTKQGPEGLVKNKKMVVITSRGGDYSSGSPFNSYDLQEPYLRTIFGFVGFEDIAFINTQPMDMMGPEVQKEKIEEARNTAAKLAEEMLITSGAASA